MSKITEACTEIRKRLTGFGFPAEFADAVCSYMNTPYTAKRMLGYLKNAVPQSMEEVADEMLAILQERDKYVQKHIAQGRKRPVEDRYIRSLTINWELKELKTSYVAKIPALRSLDEMEFSKRITFFCGENGSGKSTLLEAIAIACGLNPEGGTRNYDFSTYDDYSVLRNAVKLRRGINRPGWSYFLRAESFYNVATAALQKYNDDGRMPDYHARSHGESFLDFILDNHEEGLYLMDEPETALSPQRQLELLAYLVKMSKAGSQFIISTHSPILLGTPDAEIYAFDDTVHPVEYEETESYKITRLFLDGRTSLLKALLREADD